MPDTARDRLEAEAAEMYPVQDWDYFSEEPVETYGYEEATREGFIAGRTVTAEQVEAAAEALWNRSPFAEALEVGWDEWSRQNPNAAELWEDDVRFTLTAAGFLIEGDDDEQ